MDNPRIVILDGYTVNPGDNPWTPLEKLGQVTVYDRSAEVEIVPRARDAEILLVNKTPLTAAVLERLPRLRFICELASGYDNVDTVAAGKRGIPVANVPGYGTDSVAQHTMALLLELCNRVGDHDRAVHEGEWISSTDFSFWRSSLMELAGKKMGIVGFGRIGRRVAEIAAAFGMEVLVCSSHRPEGAQTPVAWLELEEVLSAADVVSLHCPLNERTRRLVGRETLALMAKESFLINTARGGLVDEAALAEALNAGTIAGAAVDVVDGEPMRRDNPLLSARNCLITPHIAWASLGARRRLLATAVENIAAFLSGNAVNVVNRAFFPGAPSYGAKR